MHQRTRILLLTSSVILLCCCLIVGGTYALFTENGKMTAHLKAGELDATLTRHSYKYAVLDEAGVLKETTGGSSDVDFTEPTNENFFGITKDMRIVPGSYFEAVMTVGNGGSTAFHYGVELKLDTAYEKHSAALADQLYVTLGTVEADGSRRVVKKGFLNDGALTLSQNEGLVPEASSQKLFILVEFLDESDERFGTESIDNDLAQLGELRFDLVVTATQATK